MEWFQHFGEEGLEIVIVVLSAPLVFLLLIFLAGFMLQLLPQPRYFDSLSRQKNDLTDRGGCCETVSQIRDMITGQTLQSNYHVLHVWTASGYFVVLNVNPNTAEIIRVQGLNSLSRALYSYTRTLARLGKNMTVNSSQGQVSFLPDQWHAELSAGTLPEVDKKEIQQSDRENILGFNRGKRNPLLEALPGFDDDDDDEKTNPFISIRQLMRETEGDLGERDSHHAGQTAGHVAGNDSDDVSRLLAKYLECSDGVDHRAILLRKGTPVGYPSVGYESLRVEPLSELESAELMMTELIQVQESSQ